MRRALLLTGIALLLATAARAQVPSGGAWATLESDHFRVTYTRGLEPPARHAAAAAERARAALEEYIGPPPSGKVDVVLSDNVDLSNGSATPFPSSRIFLYAKPPVDVAELNYVHDWIELVVAHELAHSFHLEASSRAGRTLRSIFGRVPFSWPFFPAVATPGWNSEGLAVAVESALTPLGRLHGTWHDMVARTAALEDGIDDIDRLGSDSPLWPGGQRVYTYGALFFAHLEERYGADAARRIVRGTATAAIPPALWFDRVGERALGTPFRDAYDEWCRTATAGYRALADTLRAAGLTRTRSLVAHGGIAARPRFSPDGRAIAYTAHDRRSAPAVRVVDARSGRELRTHRTSGDAGPSWFPDGALLVPLLEFRDPEHIFYDLHRFGARESERLTRGARLQDADVAPAGERVVAVRNSGGTNQLVLLDAHGRSARPLTPLDPQVHWSAPRWSPEGGRIAVSRWSSGGRYDVVVLDTLGSLLHQVTSGIGINADPAWTPDARHILFASDRTGISNLYAYALADGTLHQLTSVLTGAFSPDVSPDGRTVAFSVYHADGYHIELLDFDAAALRPPAPARLPQLPLPAPPRARLHSDTLAGPARAYRAWRSARPHFWAPAWLGGSAGDFFGATAFGSDLVARHAWSALLAFDPHDGRSAGAVSYQYRGLPPAGALKPLLALSAAREWDRVLDAEIAGDPYVDEREDLLAASIGVQHAAWHSSAGAALAGELVQRRRHLYDGAGARLIDPEDRLVGLRVTTSYANARSYPFSISAEDGLRLQFSARERWDRAPSSYQDTTGVTYELDHSYRELTAWIAAYRALGRTAFAHSVLALRASALWRDGPGAATHGVGGSSGGGVAGLGFIDTGSEFLPVRGFAAAVRRGTRAWSGTAELRLPLLLIARQPRPLPFFLHSLAGALFVDAGDASCPADLACGPRAAGPTLLAAGGELALDASLLGFRSRLRTGLAVPLHGAASTPRFYLQLGPGF